MLHIWLVQLFMSWRVQVEFTNAPCLVGTVVHVTESSELNLPMLHVWLVRSFMSRGVTS